MVVQGTCPIGSEDDKIFKQEFRTSDGKSVQDLINLRANLTEGSMKGGGGVCQYTIAVVLTLVAAGASYFVIANTLASAGVGLDDINVAKANLEVVMNQSCGTMEQAAATALLKHNGFSPVDCTDYHAQVAKLAIKGQEFIQQQSANTQKYIQTALAAWAGVMGVAATICNYCYNRGGKKSKGRRKTKRSSKARRVTKSRKARKARKSRR
jgi:putative hemolysin